MSSKKHIKAWISAFTIALLLLVASRFLLMQSLIIHDTSMSNTLLPGDFIFINKIVYGARLPNTPLSIPYTDVYSDKIRLPYLRFPGKGNISRNDLIAFNYPHDTLLPTDRRPLLVKRLIAIPGDTISMNRKKVFVNKNKVIVPTAQYAFIVECKNRKVMEKVVSKYHLAEGGKINKNTYKLFLTNQQTDTLIKYSSLKSINLAIAKGPSDFMFNSTHNPRNWNQDCFDKLLVPKKGMTVHLTLENCGAYEAVIQNYEKNNFDIRDSSIFINGVPTVLYTFRNNYYFVLDDNRDNSNDSRNWGFLPEEFILGKATRILFSFNGDDKWWRFLRVSRTLKKIQ